VSTALSLAAADRCLLVVDVHSFFVVALAHLISWLIQDIDSFIFKYQYFVLYTYHFSTRQLSVFNCFAVELLLLCRHLRDLLDR